MKIYLVLKRIIKELFGHSIRQKVYYEIKKIRGDEK